MSRISIQGWRSPVLGPTLWLALGLALAAPATARDITFLFAADIHACLVAGGTLAPNCAEEGKTDQNLRRHVEAMNRIGTARWPETIDGKPSGLPSAGAPIARPLGLVIGGDITDDGGGQVRKPGEGRQLQQFASHYREGSRPGTIRYPVWVGLGNHDLDQDGPPPHEDFYRREMRDYVELEHRSTVFYEAPVPAMNYDEPSDNYSWDWQGVHFVQLQRFGGDTRKKAESGLDWLKADLAFYAADGRPVVLFQHYGWDDFSTEHWDPAKTTFDPQGTGDAHWWTPEERDALVAAIAPYNVLAIFHGHQHETPMIYQAGGFDLVKPVAGFMGGFAVARITDDRFEVALADAVPDSAAIRFTTAFHKPLTKPFPRAAKPAANSP